MIVIFRLGNDWLAFSIFLARDIHETISTQGSSHCNWGSNDRFQPLSDAPQVSQPDAKPASENIASPSEKTVPAAPPKITPPSPVATQVISMNAHKVPYLGFNGVFNLNTEHQNSVKDPR
ncbi:hypothetical protein QUA20_31360, partial [Microcoleus sp. Pol7_A1]